LMVKVSAQTRFEGVTKTFAGLKAGMQAEVGGTPASKGIMVASVVNTGTSDQQEGSGGSSSARDISRVGGTGGAASVTVKDEQGTVTITVSTTTTFTGVKGIADLKAGMRVVVKGAKQSNGSIAAQQVTVDAGGHGDS